MAQVKDSKITVTAVIVTYQSGATVGNTLGKLRKSHDEGILDCVVVDNDSKDETATVLQTEADWVDVIFTGTNSGFGQGCNIGLARVTSPYTLFLNPDAIVEPETIRAMTSFMDAHPEAGICGPATVVGDSAQGHHYQGAGRRTTPVDIIRSAIPLLRKSDMLRPIVPGTTPFQTEWICGAIFMVRTEVIRRLGGFDPRFFLYWEETDVCRRVEDSGFQVWAVGTAVAKHIGGASSTDDGTQVSGCIAEHFYQSRRYYLVKHHGWIKATLAELVEFVLIFLTSGADLLRGRGMSRLKSRLQAPLFSSPRTR